MKRIIAKLFLPKQAIELAEEMKKNGVKIKTTKVPSLTGSHNVYEVVSIKANEVNL